MTYNELFLGAWESVLKKYEHGEIRFLSESDLRSHLFSECLNWLQAQGAETPYKIYAEKSIICLHKKTDLVLGDDEVAVEIKFEPHSRPGNQDVTWIRKLQGSGSIEHDIGKTARL